MNIAGFYEESISNGEGWRAVLFVSGCPHKCEGCHNMKAWDENYGEPFNKDKIIESLKNNPILKGITLSGGEPFLYCRELIPFVEEVKELGLDVWIYTGYTIEELFNLGEDAIKLLNLTDVLVDGRFVKELKDTSLVFRGSSNQRIIDMNKFRKGFDIEQCLKVYEDDLVF